MKKVIVIICHEHGRVRRFGEWIPYVELLKVIALSTEAFEFVVQQAACDKCKEEKHATRIGE